MMALVSDGLLWWPLGCWEPLPAYGISLQAVPLPLEQLEVALEAAAALRPYDLMVPDQIKILVPVPQALYEPGLLKEELVDPIFGNTITELMTELNGELGQRQLLRDMGVTVTAAIDPALIPEYPDPDPDAVPDESPTAPAAETDTDEEVAPTHAEATLLVVLVSYSKDATSTSSTKSTKVGPEEA